MIVALGAPLKKNHFLTRGVEFSIFSVIIDRSFFFINKRIKVIWFFAKRGNERVAEDAGV